MFLIRYSRPSSRRKRAARAWVLPSCARSSTGTRGASTSKARSASARPSSSTSRSRHADSQSLMITGNASLDAAVRAIQESVDDFLQKPVNPDQLKLAISKSLEKMQLRQRGGHG